MDTAGPGRELGRFWAAATGCSYAEPTSPDDPGELLGTTEGMGIAICRVPEEKTVKNRVHLDVLTDSVESLLALGARLAPGYGGDPWTVLLDPEGGELCAFVRDGELPAYRGHELVLDSVAAEAQARWWGGVFGAEPENDGDPWWSIGGVPGFPMDAIVFDPVPEPKSVKNRIHWDVYGEVREFTAAGATVLAELPRWSVMADLEGNEFCVFPEPTPAEPL